MKQLYIERADDMMSNRVKLNGSNVPEDLYERRYRARKPNTQGPFGRLYNIRALESLMVTPAVEICFLDLSIEQDIGQYYQNKSNHKI